MEGGSESIGERVAVVLDRIRRAALRAGRAADTIRLVAATKTVPVERIREAWLAGVRHCGENRLQEALPKIEAFGPAEMAWHFIGTLQRRKVKSVVGRFQMIHSVDGLALAEEIDRRAAEANLRQPVLLEVNLGGEVSKGGFAPDELAVLLPELDGLSHIEVRGLMAIPPPTATSEEARPFFRRLRELSRTLTALGSRNINMTELSMGMSQDYEVAIEEGATYVRIGTAIFGARHV
ncbi:MAG TPA: YggS family pyridoxal phosphate-dependent enzyme [Nitrospiraceae bacterium]|jgi:pyridoxal phosphate enzyme (YggS family)|nr:YggS family pyridoxal phosphate-dependent enzyme [Nitrospiraceae bacterium]